MAPITAINPKCHNPKEFVRDNLLPGRPFHAVFDSVDHLTAMIKNALADPNHRNAKKLEALSLREANSFNDYYTAKLGGGGSKNSWEHLVTPPPVAGHVQDMIQKVTQAARTQGSTLGLVNQRKRFRRLVEGDDIDISRFLDRNYDSCFEETRRTRLPGRIIRLGCNVAVNCDRRPKEFWPRGAVLVALADILAGCGAQVEIWLVDSLQHLLDKDGHDSTPYELEVLVKPADRRADVTTLAYAFAEIGFFRTIGFLAVTALAPGKPSWGLGSAQGTHKSVAAGYDWLIDSGEDVYSVEAAVGEIKKALKHLELSEEGVR